MFTSYRSPCSPFSFSDSSRIWTTSPGSPGLFFASSLLLFSHIKFLKRKLILVGSIQNFGCRKLFVCFPDHLAPDLLCVFQLDFSLSVPFLQLILFPCWFCKCLRAYCILPFRACHPICTICTIGTIGTIGTIDTIGTLGTIGTWWTKSIYGQESPGWISLYELAFLNFFLTKLWRNIIFFLKKWLVK